MASINAIREATAARFGIRPDALTGSRRLRRYAWPRQLAMTIARETGYSLGRIGQNFGGRHHTTILFGSVETRKRIASDPVWRGHYKSVMAMLQMEPQGV